MKKSEQNEMRKVWVEKIMDYVNSLGEDVGQTVSNTFNFPVVTESGDEGWVEVIIKVPNDSGDEGYLKRDSYQIHLKNQEEKKKADAEKKAKQIAHTQKMRELKKAKLQGNQ